MTELELMNRLACGESAFCREDFADFEAVDRTLTNMVQCGYVEKIVRSLPKESGGSATRVDVVGGLTASGEMRRRELFPMTMMTNPMISEIFRTGFPHHNQPIPEKQDKSS